MLNKLYPENTTQWDHAAPIASGLGEVEITDQPRRRSSVSETLGNIFGHNKPDTTHETIQEANTPEQGSTHGAMAPAGAAAVGAGTGAAAATTTSTGTGTTTGATGLGPAVNCNESISSTRATRGEIVPDRTSEEVKDRSGATAVGTGVAGAGMGAAAIAAGNAATAGHQTQTTPVQRDASPPAPRHRNSLQGIKDKAAAAVRRLSGRRSSKSSIQKDSIQVRHLSDAEMFKNQALGSMGPTTSTTTAAGATTGTAALGSTAIHNNNAATTNTTQETPVAAAQHPELRRGSTSSSEHLKYTGVQKGFARIPGVHTLRPAEDASAVPANNASYFIKEEDNKMPTKSSLVSGHMEHRRGSIQETVGKIINNGSMQDQGALKQVSGQSKINAYNAAHNKL